MSPRIRWLFIHPNFLPKRKVFQVKRHFCILREKRAISKKEKKIAAGAFFFRHANWGSKVQHGTKIEATSGAFIVVLYRAYCTGYRSWGTISRRRQAQFLRHAFWAWFPRQSVGTEIETGLYNPSIWLPYSPYNNTIFEEVAAEFSGFDFSVWHKNRGRFSSSG